ncbi:MAG: GAF domain-containing protein [Phormidesmis sp.]
MTLSQRHNALQQLGADHTSFSQMPSRENTLHNALTGSSLQTQRTGFEFSGTAEPVIQDTEAVAAALPSREAERIQKLLRYQILDTEPEIVYDAITARAAKICDTESALISFVDIGRQWFKSKVGIEISETPRDHAFCSHTILQSEVLIVPDTWADERFTTDPLMIANPHIRFYAGAPLITAEGFAMGSVCVIDSKPKQLTSAQISTLTLLSHQVVNHLELRLMSRQIQQEVTKEETDNNELHLMMLRFQELASH